MLYSEYMNEFFTDEGEIAQCAQFVPCLIKRPLLLYPHKRSLGVGEGYIGVSLSVRRSVRPSVCLLVSPCPHDNSRKS